MNCGSVMCKKDSAQFLKGTMLLFVTCDLKKVNDSAKWKFDGISKAGMYNILRG